MDHLVTTYLAYVLLAVPLTVWVGRTLFRSGRVFLLDVFDGDEELAARSTTSRRRLLPAQPRLRPDGAAHRRHRGHHAGRRRGAVGEARRGSRWCSERSNLGNLYVLNKLRRRAVLQAQVQTLPPVQPDAVWGAPPNVLPA
jgi:hypothetical protein